MSKRKTRCFKLEEKRKERQEKNFKKNKYKEMSENGELGNRDLQNYGLMYNSFNRPGKENFKHPDQNPTRGDYIELKRVYHNSINSLTGRVNFSF